MLGERAVSTGESLNPGGTQRAIRLRIDYCSWAAERQVSTNQADGPVILVFNFSTRGPSRTNVGNWRLESVANMMWKTFLVHSSWYGKGDKASQTPLSWASRAGGVFHSKWIL